MSNETHKADQIAHRLYFKLALVVHHARATAEPLPNSKSDKWFNLETPDSDLYKDATRVYRSISTAHTTSPFSLQVLLCVPELNTNQVLVYRAPDSSRQRIDPAPKFILLESWELLFTPNHARPAGGNGDDRADVAPPTMYKHAISLFRSIFTLLRILPTWKLARRLRRRGNGAGNFSIQLHVHDESSTSLDNILGFDEPPTPNAAPFSTTTYAFPPIPHPAGLLTLSSTSLATPHFQIDALESILSSRFLSLDEGPEFTPTLTRHAQRSSASVDTGGASGSPRSFPTRALPPSGRSPPSMSVADRFVVSPSVHSRTTSFPTLGSGGVSPRMTSIGLPGTARAPGAGSTSGLSDASSSRQAGSIGSRDDSMGQGISALAARLRKESLGAGRSSDSSSATPGALPIRRSPMHPVHPFKASTLSSSPSLHSPSPSLKQHSPLSSAGAGPSLPSRPPHSPTSSRTQAPGAPFRPSPTFAPSSLGDRRSLVSAEGVLPPSPAGGGGASPRMTSGKRYSSSFGHRYGATGGAGSEGSAGSGAKEERIASASFLSTNTDDDDISAFVQDIDSRQPLALRGLPPSPSLPTSHAHDPQPLPDVIRESDPSSNADRPPEALPAPLLRTVSVHEPMLTTQSAVDARLAEMNATFAASLEGLSGRRRRGPAPLLLGGGERQQEGLGLVLEGVGSSAGAYVRPRLASTGSARSGLSIASEEVLGRMDPEVGEEGVRRRER